MGKLLSTVLPPITTRDKAVSAVKMAGFPVFLIGMAAFLFGLVRLMQITLETDGATTAIIVQMVLGAALVLVSFSLRKGHPGFALLAFALSVANFGIAFLFSGAELGALWVFKLIIPAVMVVLTLNGLRAWLWLRRKD